MWERGIHLAQNRGQANVEAEIQSLELHAAQLIAQAARLNAQAIQLEQDMPIRDEPEYNMPIRDESDEELADLMYAAPENRNQGKRKRMSKKRLTMKKCMKKNMNWVKKSNRNRGYCRK